MRLILNLALLLLVFPLTVSANEGLVSIRSEHDASTTADRLVEALKDKGVTVFARIDHAQAAQEIGKDLRPTEVIIFGNPKIGTPLMQCGQSVAIDLPQKALVWEDQAGRTWLSYNDPKYLADRHGIEGCDQVIKKMSTVLGNFAEAATKLKN